MKTKEEVIKEAWEKLIPDYTSINLVNGWSLGIFLPEEVDYSLFDTEYARLGYFIRPKSLQGIENNNGWFSINESLPNESGYYVMYNSENIMLLIELNSTTDFKSLKQQFLKDGFTHYQPIIKPNKPHY